MSSIQFSKVLTCDGDDYIVSYIVLLLNCCHHAHFICLIQIILEVHFQDGEPSTCALLCVRVWPLPEGGKRRDQGSLYNLIDHNINQSCPLTKYILLTSVIRLHNVPADFLVFLNHYFFQTVRCINLLPVMKAYAPISLLSHSFSPFAHRVKGELQLQLML